MPIVAPAHPGRLLRRGASRRPGSRSRTARRCSCCPTATWPTAPSRGGSRTSTNCPTCACSSRPGPNHTAGRRHRGLLALQARPADPGPPLGRPRHARPRAPHRRHREAGRHRQHLLRPGQPRLHGPHPPGQDRRHRGPGPGGRRPGRRRPKLLVLGWGSTYGPITAAVRRLRARRASAIAQAHLRHLNPFPRNLGEVLKRYDKVVVPEMNLGQLATLLRAKYLVDAASLQPGQRHAVQGRAARHGSQGGHRWLRRRRKAPARSRRSPWSPRPRPSSP